MQDHSALDLLQLAQLAVFLVVLVATIAALRSTAAPVHERVMWIISAVVLLFIAGPGAQVFTGHSDLRPLGDLWSLSMLLLLGSRQRLRAPATLAGAAWVVGAAHWAARL